MMCSWQELCRVLPKWIADELVGRSPENMEEIRLRLGKPPELKIGNGYTSLQGTVIADDLNFVINTASRYSPWTAVSIGSGYITAPGGHRIGICGEAVMKGGRMDGIRKPTGLCIRLCKDYPGIGKAASELKGSILILGPPGSGKTTLLRDILRQIAEKSTVSVVDEREEIFPDSFTRGKRMDVLTGCRKAEGVDMVLRTMGPEVIGVDEITSETDCDALIRAGWCGVRLIATAHAGSVSDLKNRPVYKKLAGCALFEHILVLKRDKSWYEERMEPCTENYLGQF